MNKNRSISRVTSVTILRHGQTEANNLDLIQGITDNPLNETGKKQALETSNKIGSNYNCFITSPLKRAYETLDIVCTNKKIFKPIRSSELCIERNFGVLENIKRDPKIENFFGDYSGYIDNKLIEGFESNEKLIKRSKKFFKYLNKYYNSNNILIVSHAHFIKALLTSNTNTNYFDYNIPNCSITNFEIANNNFDLINTDLEKK